MTTSRRWTLAATILGSGIVFLDSTVVTVALPAIGRELPTTRMGVLEAQSYVYNAYLLTLSALVILAGALTDARGRRRMYSFGLVGFGLTSIMCGAAPTMELLIVGRVLQGAAGAFLIPGSLSIITAAFRGEQQGRAFGIWAGASAATTILGPLVGGVLVDGLSWRAAFFVNVPLVLVAGWATARYVEESRDLAASRRIDWAGAAVVALGVGGLSFGLIRGQERQWEDSLAWGALGVGLAGTALFVVQMLKSPTPLLPRSLFASRNFTVVNVSTFIIYGALYVVLYLLTIHLQGTLGYNATAAGLASVPGIVLLALFSERVGRMAGRSGPRAFMAAGPAVMALGALLLARLPVSSEAWVVESAHPSTWVPPLDYVVDVLPGVLVFWSGAMIMVTPLTSALMSSVPVRNAGLASAFNNAVSRIGPQLAGAAIFIAVTAIFYSGLVEQVPGLDPSSPEVRATLAPLNAPGDVAEGLAEAARRASAQAFWWAMVIAAGLLGVGAVVSGVGIVNQAVEPEPVGAQRLGGTLCVPFPEELPPVEPAAGQA